MAGRSRRNVTIQVDPVDFINCDPQGIKKQRISYAEGYGLFATQDFEKGAHIVNYRGIHSDEICEDLQTDPYVYAYQLSTGDYSFIDARAENCGLGRFINDIDAIHKLNMKPKVITFKVDEVQKSTIAFYATDFIKAGM